MGYTHYWTQKRNLTNAEWSVICEDIASILKEVAHNQGVPLANAMGEGGTSPELFPSLIGFNGVGDDSHESFCIRPRISKVKEYARHNPAWDFCKTAHKPYDVAVTAVLCYLSTITRRDDPITGWPIVDTEAYAVTSDGGGSDWLHGLELARQAIPRKANQLDIPMDIMRAERWCAPWVNCTSKGYDVNFCIDGCGYVLNLKTGESYCFESHMALAQWLEQTKHTWFKTGGATHFGQYGRDEPDIWNAYGSFDKARHARIAKAQATRLAPLFPVPVECAKQPPAYVRPGQMPDNAGRKFCYSIKELLELQTA